MCLLLQGKVRCIASATAKFVSLSVFVKITLFSHVLDSKFRHEAVERTVRQYSSRP